MRSADAQGFVVQAADRTGRPLDASRRAWPQTEAFKAHLARFEAGCPESLERATGLWEAFRRAYIDPAPAGGWIDHYGADGRPIAGDIPASTGYHIVSAISEMARVAARAEAAEGAAR
jgi:mannose-6-phosphate isomerase